MFQINWKIKSILYRLLFFFRAKKLLFFIQKKITKRANVEINHIHNNWKYHLKTLKDLNCSKILEFGAGKNLEQNIFLSYKLNNNLSQTVIDKTNMFDFTLFNQASNQIAKILNMKKKQSINSFNDLKSFYNIEYIAPCSVQKIEKNGELYDACISSNTLEHLPVKELENIFLSLKKIIKKNFIISSLIDYSDHFSHTDKNIGPLNFLQYNENEWNYYNSPYFFQNRLRHQDFRNFFVKLNYEIVHEKIGNIAESPKIVSKRFDIDNKETYILWGHFVLKNRY